MMCHYPASGRFYSAVITGANANMVTRWREGHEGPNTIIFDDMPTFSYITNTNGVSFEDPYWLRSYVRLDRAPPRWGWGSPNSSMPPRFSEGYRSCMMTVTTAPSYECTGFLMDGTPRLEERPYITQPVQMCMPSSLLKIASFNIPAPAPVNIALALDPNEGLVADVAVGGVHAQGNIAPPGHHVPPPPGTPPPVPNNTLESDQENTTQPGPSTSNRPDTPHPRRRRQ